MTKKIDGADGTSPINTFDRLTGNQKAFSVSDYAETEGKLQLNLLAVTKSSKVTRLHRCFACNQSFTVKKMSNALVICRLCYALATDETKGKVARNNFVEKALNNFRKFLGRRVSV